MQKFWKAVLLLGILQSVNIVVSNSESTKPKSSPKPTSRTVTELVSRSKVSRIQRLEQLARLDEQLYHLYKQITASTTSKNGSATLMPMAKLYMDQYERQFVNSTKRSALQSPIAAFVMAKRLSNSSQILKSISKTPELQRTSEPILRTAKTKLLEHLSIHEFIKPILELQRFLMLDPSEIASGRLMGVIESTSLEASHCAELGQEALRKGWFVESILWLRLSLNMYEGQGLVAEVGQVWEVMEDAVSQHNRNFRLDHNFFLQPIHYFTDSEFEMTVRRAEHDAFARRKYRGSHPKLNMAFTALCRHETFQTEDEKSQLFCWYEHKRSPYLTINPKKSELVSRNPLIIQFYNVATPKAVESIRKIYDSPDIKGIKRHTTDFTDTLSMPKFTILFRPEVLGLFKTMASITGIQFSPQYCRNLEGRIHVFSPGGYDEIQSDLLGYHPKHNGDRFATTILSLSEDVQGGDTIFPYAGVAVKPTAGSILFFYNTLPNGWSDDRSMYGVCPTIRGHNFFVKFWPSNGIPVAPDQDCRPDQQNYFTFPANGHYIATDDRISQMANSERYDDLMFVPYSEKPPQSPKRNPFRI